MRKTVLVVLLIAECVYAVSQPHPLWQKAVELTRRNKPWIPGTSHVSLDVLDDKGKSTDTYETFYKIAPNARGIPVSEVEKAAHNGSDITAAQREAQEKLNREADKKGTLAFSMGDNIFDPDVQASVQAVPLEETALVGNTACAVFRFTMKKKDGSELSGTAALEKESGAPMEVTYTIKPLPRGVWTMTTVLHYADGPEGRGYLRDVSIEGTGGWLFIKKGFRTLITLDAYWKNGGS
jgi:hypothetical protein